MTPRLVTSRNASTLQYAGVTQSLDHRCSAVVGGPGGAMTIICTALLSPSCDIGTPYTVHGTVTVAKLLVSGDADATQTHKATKTFSCLADSCWFLLSSADSRLLPNSWLTEAPRQNSKTGGDQSTVNGPKVQRRSGHSQGWGAPHGTSARCLGLQYLRSPFKPQIRIWRNNETSTFSSKR